MPATETADPRLPSLAVHAQVGSGAGAKLQCQSPLCSLMHHKMTFRWTSYGIPWDLVDGYGWAETYRCVGVPVKWLPCVVRSLLPCLLLAMIPFPAFSLAMPKILAACCRQLDALPDVVVRSVGKACQENSKKWREIRDGIIDEWMPYAPPSDCWELHLTMKVRQLFHEPTVGIKRANWTV